MKVPVVYASKMVDIASKPYVVIGFREILPNEQFRELCDVIKDFGCRYVPETRKWIAKQKVFDEMMTWFESDDPWAQKFLIDDKEYGELIAATRE
jgi:hypothetical protein